MSSAKNIKKVSPLTGGKLNSRVLITLWYARISFVPLLILGIIGIIFSDVDNVEINWTDVDEVLSKLLSPLAGLIAAFIVKFTVNFLGLLAAYPVVLAHEKEANVSYDYFWTKWYDRYRLTKGLREIRWTTEVREEAMKDIKSSFIKNGGIDRLYIGVYVVLGVLFVFLFI